MTDAKPRRRKPSRDFAILGGPTEDGQGAHLLRFRDGNVSAGEIRPLREGESLIHSEVVRLHPLDEERRVCQVETIHEPARLSAPALSRPPRVSNARYRKNWDAIFDGKRNRAAKASAAAPERAQPKKRDWSVN